MTGWGPGRGHRSVTLRRDGVSATRGFDGADMISGRTRHIAVDTLGLLLAVCVTRPVPMTATVRTRCWRPLRRRFSPIRLVWVDGG